MYRVSVKIGVICPLSQLHSVTLIDLFIYFQQLSHNAFVCSLNVDKDWRYSNSTLSEALSHWRCHNKTIVLRHIIIATFRTTTENNMTNIIWRHVPSRCSHHSLRSYLRFSDDGDRDIEWVREMRRRRLSRRWRCSYPRVESKITIIY